MSLGVLWLMLIKTAVGRIRASHICPFTLHDTHRSARTTVLLYNSTNQEEFRFLLAFSVLTL